MAEEAKASSGVQDLVSRLRDEGVQAGREEAGRLVAEAKAEAAKMLADAKKEIAEMRQKAEAEIASQRTAGMEALKLAARDAVLKLKSGVSEAFARHVKRLVTKTTADPELLRALVLVLAGEAAEKHIRDREAHIEISRTLLGGAEPSEKMLEKGKESHLAISSDMLREGIELIPADDIQGGARVRLVGEDLEIDLTDEAISALLQERMLPRFWRILEGRE